MNTQKKIRHAIIGCGGIGSSKHIKGYKGIAKDVDIVAVCDVIRESAVNLAQAHGIEKIFTNYVELLQDKEIDSVSICLPNDLHAQVSNAAMRAGKHVHCEKPMALNGSESQDMLRVRDETDKILMIGLNNRFLPASQFMKQYIAEGHLGEIYHAKCGWVRRSGLPKSNWFALKERSGGGPLIDLGVHYLDVTLYLMGFPALHSVSAMTYNKFGDGMDRIIGGKPLAEARPFTVEDLTTGFIRLKNGCTISFEFSWASNIEGERIYYDLLGTEEGAQFEIAYYKTKNNAAVDPASLKIFKRVGNQEVDMLPRLNSQTAGENEFAHFISAIRDQRQPSISNAEEACQVMKLIDAIYLSAATRQEVVFE